MSKLLEGKVAVITGGGQGVGFGFAQESMSDLLTLCRFRVQPNTA